MRRFQFLPVGKSLSLIVVIFVCIVASLLLLNNLRSQILSAVRAYVSGEGFYSKGQKDAVNYLVRYARSHAEADYEQYVTAMAIPSGDREARIELDKPEPDMAVVYRGFIAAHNHPEDIDNMAKLFRHFRHVRYLSKAIDTWAQGDARVEQLRQLGNELHSSIVSGQSDPARIDRMLDQVSTLNEQLTDLEDEFSRTLGEGNRWLEHLLLQGTYAVTALLLVTGILVSWMILRQVRNADEALRRSEERYRSLVAITTSVIWTTDAAGKFAGPQLAWQAYTGQAWEQHADDGWVNALHPDDRGHVRALWTLAVAEGTIFRAEGRIFHAGSSQYRYFVAHSVPLLNPDGSVREWIGTLTDIDERKRTEEALHQASREKDNFLAMLAHELRNPLSPLRSAVHVLRRRDSTDPHMQRVHEMIERQVGHMTRLLDDLLDVSRVARGKISLRTEVVDLAQLVRVTGEDYRAPLETAGLTFSITISDGPMWVLGDPTRLSQALGNLLHNAGKFTNPGDQILVTLTTAADGRTAVLRVRDTGIGIAPQSLNGIFETFSQADLKTERGHGGLGLGLALVKGLVELHDGTVTASSPGPGKGSAFTIQLPLQPAPAQLPPLGTTAPAKPTPRRVLVIDDNRDVGESLRYLLESDGHDVTVTYTGPAGVEAARRLRPEVVLCDIGLPGNMDGFQVAHVMRDDPILRCTYLIALTGYVHDEGQRRARIAGFDTYLIKPVDPIVLDRVLASLSTAS